jgi:hypothetical protein
MNDEVGFDEAARQLGATTTAAMRVLRNFEQQIAAGTYYVFRVGGGEGGSEGGGGGGEGKKRTLFAFRTGDDALTFAQRNRLGPSPRLLRLSMAQLLTIMLHRPNVEAVLFVAVVDDTMRPGRRPEGQRVTRTELLEALMSGNERA